MEKTKAKKKIPFFIIITYIVNFFIGFNASATQFVRWEVRNEFGMNNTLFATISSVSLIVSILMTLVFTQILDRVDTKLLMIIGACIYFIGAGAVLVSTSIVLLIISFIFNGVGFSFMSSVSYPAISKLDPDRITMHVNVQQGLLSLGAFVSPLVMAVLVNTLKMSWQVAYYTSLIFVVGILVLIIFTKSPGKGNEGKKDEEEETPEEKKRRKRIIYTPAFLTMAAAMFLYVLMEQGVLNYITEYFIFDFNFVLGSSLSISLIRGGMTVSRLFGDRLFKNKVVFFVGATALSGLCIFVWAFTGMPVVALAFCLIYGIFAGPVWPTILSMGVSLDTKASGKLSSIILLCNNFGSNLGNVFTGMIVDNFSFRGSFLVNGIIGLLSTFITYMGIRDFRKRGYTPEGAEWAELQKKKAEAKAVK